MTPAQQERIRAAQAKIRRLHQAALERQRRFEQQNPAQSQPQSQPKQ
jgi:hypothetical protein